MKIITRENKLTAIAGFAISFVLSARATIFTPISNLNQLALAGGLTVGSTYSPAVSFTTGEEATCLSSISVSECWLGGQFHLGGNLMLSLYNNSGGEPGSSLTTLSSSVPMTLGSEPETVVYNDPNLTPLQADTTYWIVETEQPAAPLPFCYGWVTTDSADLDTGSSWTLGETEDYDGNSWNDESGYSPQFSVQVSDSVPVPEPSASVLTGLSMMCIPVLDFFRRLRMISSSADDSRVA